MKICDESSSFTAAQLVQIFVSIIRMESESSHSLASPSETPNTTKIETCNECISQKRGRKSSTSKPLVNPQQRSKYWEHCDKGSRKLDNRGVHVGICKY
ncbi:hypothetical protein OROMI_002501 [Orobanche minor]